MLPLTDGQLPTIPGTQDGMTPGRWPITAPGMPVGTIPGMSDGIRRGTATGTVPRCGDGPIGALVLGMDITTMAGLPGMTTFVTGAVALMDIAMITMAGEETTDVWVWQATATRMDVLPVKALTVTTTALM